MHDCRVKAVRWKGSRQLYQLLHPKSAAQVLDLFDLCNIVVKQLPEKSSQNSFLSFHNILHFRGVIHEHVEHVIAADIIAATAIVGTVPSNPERILNARRSCLQETFGLITPERKMFHYWFDIMGERFPLQVVLSSPFQVDITFLLCLDRITLYTDGLFIFDYTKASRLSDMKWTSTGTDNRIWARTQSY